MFFLRPKKPIVLFFLVMLFTSVLFAEPSNKLILSDAERAWINAHPTLIAANETDWPPFDYVEGGSAKGYSIDIVRLIAKKTGLKIKFINGFTWTELMDKFRAGEIDIMPAIYFNKERNAYTEFSKPYFYQPSVIVTHENDKEITGLTDISDKRVAAIVDFAITRALRNNFPDLNIVPVSSAVEGIKAVALGKADAFIESIGVVSYTLKNNYIPNVKIIGNVNINEISNPALHLGVVKDNLILLGIIDKALLAVTRKEKDELYQRWLSSPSGEVNKKKLKNNIALTAQQQAWLKAHPVIRLATDIAWPPFEWINDERQYQGIAADYMQLIENKLGIRFEIEKNKPWTEVVEAVKKRRLDVFSCVAKNPQREEYVSFTRPYLSFPMVIVTSDSVNYIDGIDGLKGIQVGVVDGYATYEYLKANHPEIDQHAFKTSEAGLKAVSTGKIDAFVDNIATASRIMQKNGLTNLKVSGEMPIRYELGMAVRNDWPELVSILQLALDSISDEQRKQIHNKWIGVRYEHGFDYSLLWKSLAVFILIAALMIFYIRKLAYEIHQRKAAEVEAMKSRDEADRANQAKSEFLSRMSHELRTPMNAVLCFSQFIEMDATDEQIRENAKEIQAAGKHLLELINEVLDLSKIEAGKIDLSIGRVDLNKLISESVSLIKPLVKERAISLQDNITPAPSQFIIADEIRFKQIMLNFLSNAVKYNKVQGSIILDCEVLPSEKLRISVSDTGSGLTEEEQTYLFQPFKRLGSEITETEGTGIGLVICKRIIEAMDGSIDFTSKSGTGSIFWVDIPLAK